VGWRRAHRRFPAQAIDLRRVHQLAHGAFGLGVVIAAIQQAREARQNVVIHPPPLASSQVVCAEYRLAVGQNEQFPTRRPLRYDVAMQVATCTVINGKVVLEGVTLPEGALVTVLSTDTEASDNADHTPAAVAPTPPRLQVRCHM
jgi:hypothetical protein